jgi:hypothetical protein
VTTALKAVPQQKFQKYFQQWQHRWAKWGSTSQVTPLSKMCKYSGMLEINLFRELHSHTS